MKLLGPTRFPWLNEAVAVVYLGISICFVLSLVSYHPGDPSWDSASGAAHAQNLIGRAGSFSADLCFQLFGVAAFLLPVLVLGVAYYWFRSRPIESPITRVLGGVMMVTGLCSLLSLGPWTRAYQGLIPSGGLAGILVSEYLVASLNTTGAVVVTGMGLVLSLYLVSSFSLAGVVARADGPWEALTEHWSRWQTWREKRRRKAREAAQAKAERERIKEEKQAARLASKAAAAATAGGGAVLAEDDGAPPIVSEQYATHTVAVESPSAPRPIPAWMLESDEVAPVRRGIDRIDDDIEEETEEDIPIRVLEETPLPVLRGRPADVAPWDAAPARPVVPASAAASRRIADFELPSTTLLNEAAGKNPYDSQELKDTAAAIKSKFEEFNVLGNVTQINPGPVVTTFEFKPEAGIKLSRITTLSEDLCLGLQAESVMIDRIPGKPTVGIEVPNTKSEVISLRQILESDEFHNSASGLTIALGKDINGRIKVTAMETMPHLLIAGSTGSGKSVMLNSMIMSILYKSTPNEVRMIMIDPKRVELGMYEGIPHLLTPVITDPRKATNALRNAVLEMERRLKLLASKGARNIDQYNKKMRQLQQEPPRMNDDGTPEDTTPLPFILIIIDELADLMMLERAGVEECVTRLAQMARAVGMHVVLATQRPSVDVITGLIKANFPARISFRVATRVDSRTILDSMGAEHLLGKGDMLFLPPGSSRLVRVHGAYVSENETLRVVDFWKEQAQPQYDSTYLVAPPSDDDESGDGEEVDGTEDPMYQDAVRIVCEMGKASTSTLQRRLRLGYGRAARILDMMQRDGIIGPPDGSRPREVLKRPDWLDEVAEQYR